MSTRSRIGVVQEGGRVLSVYCHWDGYPSWVGKKLLEFYNTYEKANELIALGSISILEKHLSPLPVAPVHRWYPKEGQTKDDRPMITTHTFENPQEGVTVAYHRDRGEEFEQSSDKTLLKNPSRFFKKSWEKWGYLFKDNKWFVFRVSANVPVKGENIDITGFGTEWIPLEGYIE